MKAVFRIRKFTFLMLFILLNFTAYSANVSIPKMELNSWGRMEDDKFGIFSRAYLELLVEGGYKFGGRAEFQFDDKALEESNDLPDTYDKNAVDEAIQRNLLFKSISIEIRRIFETPLSLVYFSGTTDVFANGDIFIRDYEIDPFATKIRGYTYFPTGIDYDGIYTVKGTGIKLHTKDMSDWMNLSLYSYQDGYLEKGRYSSDFRGIFHRENLAIETFLGVTYPLSSYGIYRGGLMFFYTTGLGGEFFTQIGIPRWDPEIDTSFTIDLFYFLFEPRIRIDLFSIILTFFWHPEYYEQTATEESGIVDMYIRFEYGDLRRTQVLGGIENGLTLQTRAGEQMTYRISPYLELITSGVIWNFKINAKLYPYSLNELVETFIGIKTEF